MADAPVRPATFLPVALAFTAGFVDTLGFIALFGLFTAHVTGNFVVLGATLIEQRSGALAKLLALPVFMAVVALCQLGVRGWSRSGRDAAARLLGLQVILLLAFTALGILATLMGKGPNALATLAGMTGVAAMAVQNCASRTVFSSLSPTTVMTGNVTQLVIDLVDLATGATEPMAVRGRVNKLWPPVVAFGVGAGCGALGLATFGFAALLLPAAIVALLLLQRVHGRVSTPAVGCWALAMLATAGASGTRADSPVPAYKLERFDEDYSFLADPAARARYPEPYKFLPLTSDSSAYLSLGGEIRERADYFDAPRFGIGSAENSYDLQRILLHGDLHLGSRLRVFAQVGRHDAFGKRAPLAPVDQDMQNMQQLFLDLVPDPRQELTVRLGRQELLLNATQRFLSVREGPSIRQSYDGVRLSWNRANWHIDAFSMRPVLLTNRAFKDRRDTNVRLSGLYLSTGLNPGATLDFYWLAYDQWKAKYGALKGNERRRALGTRITERAGHWDVEAEVMAQYGTFRSESIRAWGGGLDPGYTWQSAWKPRAGVRIDVASGGNLANPGTLETFNPLFPKGLYFDESTLTTYSNLESIRPNLQFTPTSTLSLQISEAWRWRWNAHDALYMIPFVAIPQTLDNTARYVGRWTILDATWRPERHWTIQGEYVNVDAGGAVRRSGGRSVNFMMLVVQFRF